MSYKLVVCSDEKWVFNNGIEEFVPLNSKCFRRLLNLPTDADYDRFINIISETCGYVRCSISYKMSAYTNFIDIKDNSDLCQFFSIIFNHPHEIYSLYVVNEYGVGSSSDVPQSHNNLNMGGTRFSGLYENFWYEGLNILHTEVNILKSQKSVILEDQSFNNKEELKLAVGMLCINECFQFKVSRSSNSMYEAKCVEDGCLWRIMAQAFENTTIFQVRKFMSQHSCSRTQTYPNIRNANKKVLGHIIKDQLKDSGRIYRIKEIMNDIKERFKVDVSYSQAWRGKSYALELLTGSPKNSFAQLPIYCHNLKKSNPRTCTHITTNEEGRFKMFFIAMGAAIQSFVNYLRPLIIIDGAHLKGKFKGTMFLAVGMDGNNQILPIAFGIGKTKTTESWTWFLSKLKECIGDNQNWSIISDRAASIAAAVRDVFPNAFHGLCCRHLMVNLRLKSTKGKNFEQLWWKTCKAYRLSDFEERFNALIAACPNINDTLMNVGLERWSRAHCYGQRYNVMTSNSAESINALTVNARKLPITKLIEFYHECLQRFYYTRRQAGGELEHSLTKWAEDKVRKRIMLSATWTVTGVNRHTFKVDDRRKNGIVDLVARTCSCRVWDLSGLPCGHVIAISRFSSQTDCSHWALDWFSTDFYKATYEDSVNPLPDLSEWDIPEDFVQIQPPLMNKRQAGRPRQEKRIPSRGEQVIRVLCSRCGEENHHRDQCRIPMSSQQQSSRSTTSSHIINDAYQQATFVDVANFREYAFHTTGQPSQPWDFDLNEP